MEQFLITQYIFNRYSNVFEHFSNAFLKNKNASHVFKYKLFQYESY